MTHGAPYLLVDISIYRTWFSVSFYNEAEGLSRVTLHPHLRATIYANFLHSCVGVFTSLLMVQVYGCSSLGGSEGNHDLGMTFVICID